ncbi:hypothetical protein B0A55_04367 [Friedmanniomyces simplex]|uniref:Uncharacterized protein n=1 Tax=Friedmanniomyces simplex TaxID=329884 RepID=A0A4U0XQF9_9PEZI|nr:hypothetical protein B0A55_04367 [Friedmanniomyces simplex]
MTSSKSTLPDFIRLSESISIYRPDATSTTIGPSQKTAPQTIILCAWFGALPKHIAKYTTAHRTRNPTAQILLIRSGVADMLFTSHATQRIHLQPAVQVLKAAHATGHRIFLHVFSNGGTNSAVQLAHAWRDDTQTPLPIDAMVLDSCPGSPELRLAAAAVIMTFPKDQQWWATIIVWNIIVPPFVLPTLVGDPNLVEWMRVCLNDESLFTREVPRVYLYSQADRLVPWSAVQEHCASAQNAGYPVKLVRFRDSPHVAHVNENSERYWGAVDDVQQGSGPGVGE